MKQKFPKVEKSATQYNCKNATQEKGSKQDENILQTYNILIKEAALRSCINQGGGDET